MTSILYRHVLFVASCTLHDVMTMSGWQVRTWIEMTLLASSSRITQRCRMFASTGPELISCGVTVD